MTPRQWLKDRARIYLIDHAGDLTNQRIWEVIEGQARRAYANKLNKKSAIWDYYLSMSDKQADRLINEVRASVNQWYTMIDRGRERKGKTQKYGTN